MILGSGAQLAIAVLATMILARLLTPADFGVFAMALLLLGLVYTVRDFGLPSAAIESPSLSPRQASGLFWLNQRLSAGLALAMLLGAPLIAWLFGERALVPIMIALAVGVALAGLGTIHVGLLARHMRFGHVALVETGAVAAGAIVAVLLAIAGAGVWALVGQQAVTFGMLGLLPWLLCDWRPDHAGRDAGDARADASLDRLTRHGTHLSATRVLTYAGRSAGFALTGYALGARALGLFQVATRWAELPGLQIGKPLAGVLIASGSRLRDDIAGYRAHYRAAVRVTSALILPSLALLVIFADEVVRVLLGSQWTEAVPLFRLLAVASMLDIGRLSTNWMYQAEGRTRTQMRWALVTTPVMVAAVALGLLWGVRGVAVGYTIAIGLLLVPTIHVCMHGSPLGPGDFWHPVARPAAGAALATIAASALPHVGIDRGSAEDLLLRAATFLAAFALVWLATAAGRREVRALLAPVARLAPPGPMQRRVASVLQILPDRGP